MDEHEWPAARFEENRTHLRAVAHRMLGSISEADDAVQEAWLKVSRSGAGCVENLGGWLTTVVARVCLDLLRGRPRVVFGFTMAGDKIVEIELVADPGQLRRLDLAVLEY